MRDAGLPTPLPVGREAESSMSVPAVPVAAPASAEDTELAVFARARTRLRDRRAGVFEVFTTIAEELAAGAGPSDVRDRFEAMLRGLLPLTSVRLRECAQSVPPLQGQPDPGGLAEEWLPVRVSSGARPAALHVTYSTPCPLDDWDRQTLTAGVVAAGLLLELERMRFAAGIGVPLPRRGDAAAPLIGSSAAMKLLRARVERVATTDFTVLIEGPIER